VPWDEGQPQALATDFTSGLSALAFDPRRRRAAVAIYEGPTAEKVIRVLDLESGEVQVLGPPAGAGDGDKGTTIDMKFTPDGRLLSCGTYGLMRWNLEDGSGEVLARNREWWQAESLAATPDGRFALTTFSDYTPPAESVLTLYDLEDGSSQAITSHGQWLSSLTLDPTGKLIVTGGMDGIVRVGPMTGEEPHLLLGHEGLINWLAVSPDGLWVASASFDGTIRLWPMPDMDQPPFHTLPYEELLAKLRALTNLRVVEDEDSATGYKLEVGPFPGWEEVPTW
jgi:WD40 repeat protein